MAGKKWVFLFDEVSAAEQYVGGDWDKVRGLLGGKGANLADMTRIGLPVPAVLHGHHGSLQRVPGRGEQVPRRNVGPDVDRTQKGGGTFGQEIWRSQQPAPGFLPVRRQILHAWHDGYGPQHRPER